MRAKLLKQNDERIFVVFETGDDPVAGLTRFASEQKLGASAFTAIGAFSEAVLGYFDWDKKDYERIPVKEQVEVLALVGDIALQAGKPKLHAHVVLGRRDGSACGGHLLEARPAYSGGDRHGIAGASAARVRPGEQTRPDQAVVVIAWTLHTPRKN